VFSAEAENSQAPAECKSSATQLRWWRHAWICRWHRWG